MIKMAVIGHLGKDAITNLVNGKTVINFSVAHTERYKDASGVTKDKTIWVECSQWTDRTAILPYLKKGTQVYVEGNPDIRTYTTQDNRQGASIVLRVSTIQLLGTRASSTENAAMSADQANPPATTFTPIPHSSEPQVEDDLPF